MRASAPKVRPALRIVIRDVVKEPAAMQRLEDIARLQGAAAARVPAFFVQEKKK